VPTVSIRDQLKKLVELQAIDFEIYSMKRELKEKPALLGEMKLEYETSQAGLKTLEDKLKAVQVARKNEELELQSKEEAIVKANAQLNVLKTNKEYQAKLLEIEGLKADRSRLEEKILNLYDEGDAITAQTEKEKKVLADVERTYTSQRKEIEDSVRELAEKIKQLTVKRQQVAPEIEKVHLSRYERILENKDGLALVPVKDNACGGCFMNVPEQVINEIKMHDRLILCELCSRILYLEDDL